LITGGYASPSELDCMCLDDVDDLNIVLAAEAEARRRAEKAARR
jgi:hypothetical protein